MIQFLAFGSKLRLHWEHTFANKKIGPLFCHREFIAIKEYLYWLICSNCNLHKKLLIKHSLMWQFHLLFFCVDKKHIVNYHLNNWYNSNQNGFFHWVFWLLKKLWCKFCLLVEIDFSFELVYFNWMLKRGFYFLDWVFN